MAIDLNQIETIVILMLENRSFDHMLGYLSLPAAGGRALDGLSADPAWLARHANPYGGRSYPPFHLTGQAIPDPPHERQTTAIQIGVPAAGGGVPPMNGFVASYMTLAEPPADPALVMGWYQAAEVPVFDLLARDFTVCDHWFAALPTGTQANRLMAMSGETSLVDNAVFLLPDQALVYDWLDTHAVTWCAYQSGDFLPFFALMPRWQETIATSLALDAFGGHGRFRRLARLREDWTGNATMPQLIFVEPEYTDGPHLAANDDHPPTGVAAGQALVAELYNTLLANPQRWSRTVLIVTYDEHGGFFDHVPPLAIATDVPRLGPAARFATTGLRVPALIVSPFVEPGSVYAGPLDHTSILQLLADRFAPGGTYSAAVGRRQPQLSPLARALTRAAPRQSFTPAPTTTAAAAPVASASPRAPGAARNAVAMHHAAATIARNHPELVAEGLPRLAGSALPP